MWHHVKRSQRRQLFSNSPSRQSKRDDDPHILNLGKISVCWVLTGENYPGNYSSYDIAAEDAHQSGCSTHCFRGYQLALECLRISQDCLSDSGLSRGAVHQRSNTHLVIDNLHLHNNVCARPKCNRPTRLELDPGEDWHFHPNSYGFCSREYMAQQIALEIEQAVADKQKIFICHGGNVHCCNCRSRMINLQPLNATNAPKLSAGTWCLFLKEHVRKTPPAHAPQRSLHAGSKILPAQRGTTPSF